MTNLHFKVFAPQSLDRVIQSIINALGKKIHFGGSFGNADPHSHYKRTSFFGNSSAE